MGFLSFKSFKIFPVVIAILSVEAYLVIAVPTTSAYHNPPNAGGCGQYLQVTTSENPACDATTNSSLDQSYSAMYSVKSLGQPLTLAVNTQTWYCTNPYPHDGSDTSRLACRQGLLTNALTASVPAGGTKDITLARNLDQRACGSVQTDISFDVFVNGQKVCSYGNPTFVYGFSFCSTGKMCGQVSPTPTTQPSPTPTTRPSPSPTPTCTPTPTLSPSVTMSQSPTPSSAATPTPTTTPTSSPAPTAAPQTSITPTPQTSQNITVNVSQSQSQSQTVTQQVLAAATVAPAPTTSTLPSTGSGSDILFALSTLIPLGWKLRKWK